MVESGLAIAYASSLSTCVYIPLEPMDLWMLCLPNQRIFNQTLDSQGEIFFSLAFFSYLKGWGFLKDGLSSKV